MTGLISWITSKIKWLLLIAAFGGPFLAYISWEDGERVKRITEQGVEAQATIESATRTRSRRGVTSYSLDLSWQDAKGQQRTAEKVSISHGFAGRIISHDKLTVDTLRIKYLPDEPGKSSVIVQDDAGKQAELDNEMIYLGSGAGVLGVLGSGLFFLVGRRRPAQGQEQQQAS